MIGNSLLISPCGQLGLVAGLEYGHVEPAVRDTHGPRLLGAHLDRARNRVGRRIDDRDLVARGEAHVGLAVAGEGDIHRLVELESLA